MGFFEPGFGSARVWLFSLLSTIAALHYCPRSPLISKIGVRVAVTAARQASTNASPEPNGLACNVTR
jgi:hypothetical protein